MIRRASAALLLSLTALPAAPAAGAPVGTYTQYLCAFPDRTPAQTDGLYPRLQGGPSATTTNNCAAGGFLEASMSGSETLQTEAGFVYNVPADTEIVGVRIARTARDTQTGKAQYTFEAIGDRCTPTYCSGAGSATFEWSGPPLQVVPRILVSCASDCGAPTLTPSVLISELQFDLKDAVPPVIQSVSNGLFDESRLHGGIEATQYIVNDPGGGVYEIALLVDGVERVRKIADPNGGKCQKPFQWQVPCVVKGAQGEIAFDTTQLTNGTHQAVLKFWDATETNVTTSRTATFRVENVATPPPPAGAGGAAGPPPANQATPNDATSAPVGSGAVGGSALGDSAATFGGRPPVQEGLRARFVAVDESAGRGRTVRHGSVATLRGRLVDGAGRPLAGAKVDVLASVRRPGQQVRRLGTVITDRTGAVSYRLKPGASSDVTFAYRPTGARSDEATLSTTVYVRAGIRLARSRARLRNGQRLTLTARVLGAFVRRNATKVAFQVQIGRAWRTFATAKPDAKGVARIHHRFRYTTIPVTYRFRAMTTRAARFPYLPGASPVARVKVRP